MRWLFALVSFCCLALASGNPQLLKVHTVYILPMGSSMDQYLANRLARMGAILVVTDPQTADAILTDRVGEPFERKLQELYPPPSNDEEEDDDAAAAAKKKQELDQQRVTSFGRGKGTFFLVDRKTRNVLWSIYERPKNSSPEELNKTAERIVNHLKHDLKPPATTPAG